MSFNPSRKLGPLSRTVTVRRHPRDRSRLLIEPGPWSSDSDHVQRWADYLQSTGHYLRVIVEKSGR